MSLKWFVIHAYSGYENQVKKTLLERIEMQGMGDKFGKILVPTEEVVEMKDGQKHKSERKFFPGYVLVQMEMNDTTWHLVKKSPKVMGFIGGSSDKPAPISDAEANNIMNRIQEGVEKPKHKVLFEPGEVVRVMTVLSTISMVWLKKLITKRIECLLQYKYLEDLRLS